MPIGTIQTEADLRAFVLREIGSTPELVRQLQGEPRTQAGSGTLAAAAIPPQTASAFQPVVFAAPFSRAPTVLVASAVTGAWQEWLVFRSRDVTAAGFNVVGMNTAPTGTTNAAGSAAFTWIAVGVR